MDKRLKDTLNKVDKEKADAEKAAKAAEAKKDKEHEAYITSQLPAAKKWVDTYLFDRIAEAAKKGYKSLQLNEYESSVPATAIVKVANEIDGIRAFAKWEFPIDYDTGYHVDGSYTYHVFWE